MTERPERKRIPERVRREISASQGGICRCGCNESLWSYGKWQCQWDHDPALRLRDINDAGTDYIPAQRDPDHIVGRCPASHRRKTSGTGATTAGTDIGKIKKDRKRARPQKLKPKMKSRPFQQPPPGYKHRWGKRPAAAFPEKK